MIAAFYLLLTWLLASVPTGPILALLYADVDLTAHGSGNIGATNANRVLGRGIGIATLVGDLVKGFLPVALAPMVGAGEIFPGIVAIVAFLGHCFSPYLAFRGGKGVATTAGAMLALAPLPTGLTVAGWALIVGLTKKSSLGALAAVFLLPLLVAWLAPKLTVVTLILAFGVAIRHLDNVRRLLAGTEQ